MSAVRPGATGATRTCPHCKATILESAAVCPACRGHLKFEAAALDAAQRFVPLKVEGTINAADDGAFEYTMVVVIRDQRGKEIGRHVAGRSVSAFLLNRSSDRAASRSAWKRWRPRRASAG